MGRHETHPTKSLAAPAALSRLRLPGDPDMTATRVDTGEQIGAIETIRRGAAFSPELKDGIRVTFALAVIASIGQVVVPIAVQQTIDHGLHADGSPDVGFTLTMAALAVAAIVVTSTASYAMTSRLFTTSERGLATLRIK